MTTTLETKLGDRLDLLAGVYLSDPFKWEEITAVNPKLRLTSGLYLEPGILITIPELLPEKIPDLLPWNDTADIQLFEPVTVPPDVQPGSNPDELLSGSGWLTPAAVKILLAIPNYTFPLSVAQGGHGATTPEAARANLGAVGFADIPASIPPSAIGVIVAPLVNGIVPTQNLPALPPFPTLASLGGVSSATYTAGLALKLDASARSAANGVAPLGTDLIVPSSFLPAPPTLASLGGVSTSTYTTGLGLKVDTSTYTAGLALKLDAAARNAANGVAGLDPNSLILTNQIPLSVQFQLLARTASVAVDFNTISGNHGSVRYFDNNVVNPNAPSIGTNGTLLQWESLVGVASNLWKTQTFIGHNSRRVDRSQNNGTWGAWNEVSYLNGVQPFTTNQDFSSGAKFRAGGIPALTTTLTQAGVTAEGLPIYWFVNASATAGNKLKSTVVATNGNIQFRHHADDGTVGNIVEMTASGNLLTNGTVRPGSGATAFTGASFVAGAMYFRTDIVSGTGTGAATFSDGTEWMAILSRHLTHTATSPDGYSPGIRSANLNIDGTLKGWHILTNIRPNDAGFGIQIAFSDTDGTPTVKTRRRLSGTWGAWGTIAVT